MDLYTVNLDDGTQIGVAAPFGDAKWAARARSLSQSAFPGDVMVWVRDSDGWPRAGFLAGRQVSA